MSAWLTIIGLNEDGPSPAAREALARAEVIFGGARHLELTQAGARGRPWPVPFSIAPLLACRGMQVVALCSGDPFWFGAGSLLAEALAPEEWVALPAPSNFALAAAKLGWRLEDTICLGLHAAPFAQARAHLHDGARLLCLLRGGEAVAPFAAYLTELGFGASRLWRLEALGGVRERITQASAAEMAVLGPGLSPVAVAVEVAGALGLPRTPGLADSLFAHDGQITKRPVRALTLSALAPRPGEHLWDIGLGAGSISIEWLLAAPAPAPAGWRRMPPAPHGRWRTPLASASPSACMFWSAAPRTGWRLWRGRMPSSSAAAPARRCWNGSGRWPRRHQAGGECGDIGERGAAHRLVRRERRCAAASGAGRGRSFGGKRGWVPARPIVQWSVTL
ncbi:precorrin-6y C5,15-methyltransferase (decarboxylating) subunit CbiE [Acidocella sp. MX-AZ03]|uniref:precorrin-6y C5,15-methyltransferase (decarboxylating) subunit CbiE n=1 Tax=Acidocella sp. MX-AZ03 TaxID=2697363 RepID=UPI0022DD85D3|nr:precorrin-6y C5,15-methyltransferase (decarboxylating) subunit CbiE [Acidocella sp. MX-AZ03]WBO59371.1 precorrin-6y C5,15-methyltransferase (decarboxylating) subunit CbiE [Acidocella sp. MX-AZ03]